MTAFDLVGRGWSFPVDGSRRGVRLVGGAEEIEAAIRMIIGTSPGERVMRPDFGCPISELVFSPIDANLLGAAQQAVRGALQMWEPRVEVRSVVATGDVEHARVDIHISYLIRATNDLRNLVYPFYVIPSEEQPS